MLLDIVREIFMAKVDFVKISPKIEIFPKNSEVNIQHKHISMQMSFGHIFSRF